MVNKATVGSLVTNEVSAEKIAFTAVKKQNGVTTPITVKSGDIITYLITVTNTGAIATGSLPFSDTLPTGVTYVVGSFKVGSVTTTPTISGQTLTSTIPSIAPGATTDVELKATVI